MIPSPDSAFPVGSKVLTVSELVRQARAVLERSFPLGWVSGEVVSLTRAASGHVYFGLRDADAQVRCVMYRARAQLLPFRLCEGQHVEVRGLVTLYEARGEFQLQVETVRLAGAGSRFEAFLRLKARLEQEGLFDPAARRPLPRLPRGIGVVTSAAGAALHDVCVTLARRAPMVPVVVYPSPVQGDQAPARLIEALNTAAARADRDGIEVILLCRGGGDLDDLWAFNDEGLVRAIRACTVPVVTGIGHETDFTLADFAADLRAATPTAAAERVSEGIVALAAQLPRWRNALQRAAGLTLDRAWERLDRGRLRLRDPRSRLAAQADRLASARHRLALAFARNHERAATRTARAAADLYRVRPDAARHAETLAHLADRLQTAMHRMLDTRTRATRTLALHLSHLNPHAVLQRGYAIVRRENGAILRDAGAAEPGERLLIQPASGVLHARVESARDAAFTEVPLSAD